MQINDWIRRQGHDPRRGIEATVVREHTILTEHHGLLTVQVGEKITILGPPIWLWGSLDMASGEYVVRASAHNPHNHHLHSDHALLGLVPPERLLTCITGGPIFLKGPS